MVAYRNTLPCEYLRFPSDKEFRMECTAAAVGCCDGSKINESKCGQVGDKLTGVTCRMDEGDTVLKQSVFAAVQCGVLCNWRDASK